MALANTDNASGNYVEIAAASSINSPTSGTFLFWVYPTSVANAARNFVGKTLVDGGYEIFKRGTNGTILRLAMDRGTTAFACDTVASTLTVDTWQFFAVVFDLATSGNNKWYRGTLTSGAADVTGTVTLGSGAQVSDAAVNLRLLANAAGSGGWPGSLATYQFFPNVLLTLAQCQSLQWRPRMVAGCTLYMQLGFNGPTVQADWSGNLNNGTITGVTEAAHVPIGLPFGR